MPMQARLDACEFSYLIIMPYFKTSQGTVYQTNGDKPWNADDTRLSNAEGSRLYRQQFIDELKPLLKPTSKGKTRIYTVLRHRSASGMKRSISLFYVDKDRELVNLDYTASIILGDRIDNKNGGIVTTGCGMDMGFALVYNLGRALWPNGTPKPHGSRNGTPDKDGGYALDHAWI